MCVCVCERKCVCAVILFLFDPKPGCQIQIQLKFCGVIDKLFGFFFFKVTKQYLRHMWTEITNHKLGVQKLTINVTVTNKAHIR